MTDCDKIMERVNNLCDKIDVLRAAIKTYSDKMDTNFDKLEDKLDK